MGTIIKTTPMQTEIGMIPEDWGVGTIEQIASKEKHSLSTGPFGSNITKDNFIPSGVPVIRVENLTAYRFLDTDFVFVSEKKADELSSSVAKANDIVVTHRGTLGQVGIVPTKGEYTRYVVSQSGMKLTCDTAKVDPHFVFYWLKSLKGQRELLKNTSQTGVPAIAQPLSSLRKAMLPIPPLSEQQAIAKILSDLDSKIELNQEMNKTLESIAQAIFKHWFIDFEFPNENGEPYKSSEGEMVGSELGKIPEGWKVGKLANYVKAIKGCSYRSEDLKESNIALVTLKSFNRGGGFNQDGYKEYVGNYGQDQILNEGDIIIAQTDLTQKAEVIGRDAIVNSLGKYSRLIASLDLQIVRPKESLPLNYIYYLLNNDAFHNHALSYTNGTTVLHLNKNAVSEYTIVIPPKDILERFDLCATALIKRIGVNIRENDRLENIRDLLLPKLMAGKIRIPLESGNVR